LNALHEPFEHKEEKKDDALTKNVDSKPQHSSKYTFANKKQVKKFDSVSVTKQEKSPLRNGPKVQSTNYKVTQKGGLGTTVQQPPAGKTPANSERKGESLIARRRRELMLSNKKDSSSTNNDQISASQPNATSGKKSKSEKEEKTDAKKLVSEGDNVLVGKGDTRATQKTNGSECRPNPPPLSENEKQILYRASRSTASYHAFTKNLRSELEQKRIDDMQRMFVQAGLMSRIKRAKTPSFEVVRKANLNEDK